MPPRLKNKKAALSRVAKVGRKTKSASSLAPLRIISASEFAARFAHSIREKHQHFTWFLGAGCSVSSGIPHAGSLAKKWMNEVFEFQKNTTKEENFSSWVNRNHPKFDPTNPANYYADAFAERHPSPVERQREIEMICAIGRPNYGYATLAQLLSHEKYGRLCSTVLTTNFDDLIADALYLYGEQHARPLVVTDEALARYVRTNSPRPTVVKLHGDAHLNPKNLRPETREIHETIRSQLYPFLQDYALIFCGYGGNDQSIFDFFMKCPLPPLAPPIYWVSAHEPQGAFASWLRDRGAIRVDHTDFDQLLHLVRDALSIELLPKERWSRIGDSYYQAVIRLTDEIQKIANNSADTKALKSATVSVEKSLPNEWTYYANATRYEKTDPDASEKYLIEGLSHYEDSPILNNQYAIFLVKTRRKYDDAEIYFKRALNVDPGSVVSANYGLFLWRHRNDLDNAERYLKQSIESDPNNVHALSTYANFLADKEDVLAAQLYYKRCLDIDPKNPNVLGNYAQLLFSIGHTSEGIEVLNRAYEHSRNLIGRDELKVELLIYRYAFDEARRKESLAELKKELKSGKRTPDWDFSATLKRAKENGHSSLDLLTDLIKVANDKEKIGVLEQYPEWLSV